MNCRDDMLSALCKAMLSDPRLDDAQGPDAVISIEDHVKVQVKIECIVAWGLLPYLAFDRGVFGKVARLDDFKFDEAFKVTWLGVRQVANSWKEQYADVVLEGFQELKQTELHRNYIKALEVVEKYLSCSVYSHFLLGRHLADVLLCSNDPKAWFDKFKVNMAEQVSSLLRALQMQTRLRAVFRLGVCKTYKSLSKVLGKTLSSIVAVDGGVYIVIMQMLGHVPTGNIQAYEKVGSLLCGKPEDKESVSRQIVNLYILCSTRLNTPEGLVVHRALVITINAMAKKYGHEMVGLYIVEPLLSVLGNSSGNCTEDLLLRDISYIHNLINIAPPSMELCVALEAPICRVFEVFVFARRNGSRGLGEAKALLLLYVEKSSVVVERICYMFRVMVSSPHALGSLGNKQCLCKLKDGGLGSFPCEETSASEEVTLTSLLAGLSLKDRVRVKVREEEDDEEEGEEESGCNLDQDERIRGLLFIVSLTPRVFASLFSEALSGVAAIFESVESLPPLALTDVSILHYALAGGKSDDSFLSDVNVDTLTGSVVTLLSACASALGLWRHEKEEMEFEPKPLGVFALEIAPVAVAIAASLASHDANSKLWENKSRGERFKLLQTLLEPLIALSRIGHIKGHEQVAEELAESSLTVRVTILCGEQRLTFAPDSPHVVDTESDIIDPIGKEIENARKELCDEEPPIRAMGLDHLRAILTKREKGLPKPHERHLEEIIRLLCRALEDPDPYVYLTCIRTFCTVLQLNVETMLARFVEVFMNPSTLTLQGRLRLGEVLVLTARRAGATLPYYAPKLIPAFCRCAGLCPRQGKRRFDEQGRYIVSPKDDEASSLLDATFRASSLSNLAEICALAPWSAFKFSATIVALCKDVLTLERENASAIPLRRASAYVLLKVVQGALTAGENVAIHEIPAQLGELNKVLNASSTYDSDNIVRLHCDIGRQRFDELMKHFAFPTPKEKVLVVEV